MVRPIVERQGLELVDLTFGREGGRRILRVTIDREEGVDLETIAEASERISRRLDLEEIPGPSYGLEVSSPGVERPLKRPEDFSRHVGDQVRVKTARPIEGARTHTGTLAEAGTDTLTIETDGGARTLRYEDLTSARTVFDWRQAL